MLVNRGVTLFKYSLFCILIIFSSVTVAIDYEYPYLINGGAPSYFLANQSFDSSLSVFENDGYISDFRKIQLGVFHTSAFESLNTKSISLEFNILKNTFLGVSYCSISDSEIEKNSIDTSDVDNPFVTSEYYNYENNHSKLTLKQRLNTRMSFGFSLNFYETSVDSFNGSAIDFSFGSVFLSKYMDLGISFQNRFGSSVNFAGIAETIPQVGIINLRAKPFYWLNLSMRASHIKSTYDRSRSILFGTGFHIVPIKFLTVSLGIVEQFEALDVKAVPAIGIKFNLRTIHVDYVYKKMDYKPSTNAHLVAMKFKI